MKFIESINAIAARPWGMVQFSMLLGLVAYGGHLLSGGHESAGTALVTGAFALLRFEVGQDK
jgi:hypothetical protein